MKLILVEHEGFKPAMLGAMLSFGKTSCDFCAWLKTIPHSDLITFES